MCAGWACLSSGTIRFNDFLEAQASANIWLGLITMINDVKPAHVQPFYLMTPGDNVVWTICKSNLRFASQTASSAVVNKNLRIVRLRRPTAARLDPGDWRSITGRYALRWVGGVVTRRTSCSVITLPVTIRVKKTGRFPFFWILTVSCKLYANTEHITQPIKWT